MAFIVIGILISVLLASLGWYAREEYQKRRVIQGLAEKMGLQQVNISRWKGAINGFWNDFPVAFILSNQHQQSAHIPPLVRIKIKTGLPGRFYLRNRACPALYGLHLRPVQHWISPPESRLVNEQDNYLFHLSGKEPEHVDRLLSNPTTRAYLVKNVLDGYGEVILEDGYLQVIRTTRVSLKRKDAVTIDQIEKIFQEEWNLLRSIIAVLQPMALHVANRQAVILGCPYCKSELDEITGVVQCSQCRALHHETCWMENGRCSVFGCNGFSQPVVKESAIERNTVR